MIITTATSTSRLACCGEKARREAALLLLLLPVFVRFTVRIATLPLMPMLWLISLVLIPFRSVWSVSYTHLRAHET